MNLNEHEVHIWKIDLDLKDIIIAELGEEYLSNLDQRERKRYENYLTEECRRQLIISHLATRDILSLYLDCPMNRIHFQYSKFNKPYLLKKDNPRQVEFNLTHSGNIALLALTKVRRIGVDVEEIHTLQEQEQIEQNVLTFEELKVLSSLNESERLSNFYFLWTAKEALMKAIGEGFHFGADKVQFSLPSTLGGPLDLSLENSTEEAKEWTTQNFIPQLGYVAAFSTKQPVVVVTHFNWNFKKFWV